MKLKIIVHQEPEGGYWAEVPALPGCYTQGETWTELLQNIYEAIELRLSVEVGTNLEPSAQVVELAVWNRFRASDSPACWKRGGGYSCAARG